MMMAQYPDHTLQLKKVNKTVIGRKAIWVIDGYYYERHGEYYRRAVTAALNRLVKKGQTPVALFEKSFILMETDDQWTIVIRKGALDHEGFLVPEGTSNDRTQRD